MVWEWLISWLAIYVYFKGMGCKACGINNIKAAIRYMQKILENTNWGWYRNDKETF